MGKGARAPCGMRCILMWCHLVINLPLVQTTPHPMRNAIRMQTPISQALSEDIIFKYGYPTKIGGNAAAADAILNTSLTTPVILVAWEHINIQYLAADLGVKKADIPVWSGSDYDSVYELGFTGRVLQYFNRSAQHFAPSN